MALEYQGKPVCSQSSYWMHFVMNFVAVIVLLGLAIYSAFNGSWGLAIVAFLAIAPVGLYFRVIMARRCRDIGWPTFLPWMTFGIGMLANMGRMTGGASAALQPSAALVPLVIGSIDFIFMIVIGCIASKQPSFSSSTRGGYEHDPYAEPAHRMSAEPAYSGQTRSAAPAPRSAGLVAETEQEARWDTAIAAALAARQQAEQASAAPPARQSAPINSAPRPVGFGRKIV